jgi:hypothetical protein
MRYVPPAGHQREGNGGDRLAFATRARGRWDVLRPHDTLDSANPLGRSGELIIRWSLVRVQPAHEEKRAQREERWSAPGFRR